MRRKRLCLEAKPVHAGQVCAVSLSIYELRAIRVERSTLAPNCRDLLPADGEVVARGTGGEERGKDETDARYAKEGCTTRGRRL
jgi:hypothetical protein